MDFNKILAKLTTGDRVIGISAFLLFIFSFFPWYGKSYHALGIGGSYDRSGWNYFLFGIIPVLLAIAVVVVIAITRFSETKLPDLPVTWAQAYLIASGLAAFLVVLKLLIGDKVSVVSLDRKFGLFLAVLAVLGLVAGAVLKSREPAEAGGAGTAPPAS